MGTVLPQFIDGHEMGTDGRAHPSATLSLCPATSWMHNKYEDYSLAICNRECYAVIHFIGTQTVRRTVGIPYSKECVVDQSHLWRLPT